jgi:FKBP-type peptidyl-prolyl cis-trans isomerase FklB
MRLHWMLVFMALLLAAGACSKSAPMLKTDNDRLSYSLGVDLGHQFREKLVTVDPALFERGLADALSGAKSLLTDDEVRAAIAGLQTQIKTREDIAAKVVGEKNKKAGDAFLAANKEKEGVVVLPSGLQYKVLVAGTGKKPGVNDTVVCNYRGSLIDGTEFDSSYKRGTPLTVPPGNVIKGWSEALQLMTVGSKWQVFIPSELAYGERGAGKSVPPNATLIMEVELLAIK